MSSTRVVQWATGATGRCALRAVIEASDLELVGVRVYDESNVSVDAGALVSREFLNLATCRVSWE